MEKWHQFTLRRMLWAMACFGCAAFSGVSFLGHLDNKQTGAFLLAYYLFFFSAGTGIGALFGRPWMGAFLGFGCSFGLLILLTLMFPATH